MANARANKVSNGMMGFALTLCVMLARVALAADRPPSPLSPEQERATFQLAYPDLTIELVAAEPEVMSPVAVAWDEDGRMYVAEMLDYPTGPPGGKIKRLEGLDDKGRYRKATVFADRLPFPNGVLPWKGGVLVSAAPNIWFLKDTDGDGRADIKERVLTGFGEGNQQLRVNGLYWGLDNWIYGANGRSSGAVHRPVDPPSKAVSISRRDFRFSPPNGAVEAIAGFSQFGLARDDWGRRFPTWNTVPLRHVVFEDRYLARNPYLAASSSVADTADPGDQGRLYPVGPPPTTFNREPVLFFNASCGNTVYRGDLLGGHFAGSEFVCEPLTNLVHRRKLVPHGSTFVTRRTEDKKEFLASEDPWCHPVNLATGPDGALYVVDFYRQWIEHPDFVRGYKGPPINWRNGYEHGRIWRIRPRSARLAPVAARSTAATVDLVGELSHANGWRRDTAQRLLLERRDPQALPLLRSAARCPTSPLAQVHALWTLHGLGELDDDTLRRAAGNDHPGVRENVLSLCEEGLVKSAEWQRLTIVSADHADARVRLQAALLLGSMANPEALPVLFRIAAHPASDDWTRLAVLSGLKDTCWPFLQLLVEQHREWLVGPSAEQARLLTQLGALIGARRLDNEVAGCLHLIVDGGTRTRLHGQLALLAGCPKAWRARASHCRSSSLPSAPATLRWRAGGKL